MSLISRKSFRRGRGAIAKEFSLVLIALVMAAEANAGDALRFKTGRVDTIGVGVNALSRMNQRGVGQTHFIVQFIDRITTEDRRNLQSLGANIVRYVPDDALVVRASQSVIHTVSKSSPRIHAILPYKLNWKISPEFGPSSVFTAERFELVLVRLFPDVDTQKARKEIEKIPGVMYEAGSDRSLVVRIKQSQLESLAQIDAVEWIQPNPQMSLFHLPLDRRFDGIAAASEGNYEDLTGFESGTQLMNFSSAWERGFDGRGQAVSVADTGLDLGTTDSVHQDFAGHVPRGFVFGLFAEDWSDPMGHGTHVAGSVMGRGLASSGRVTGGAIGASVVPQGMWSPLLNNLTVPPRLSDLFSSAYSAGARIHTNSWGSPRNLGAYDGMAQQADEFMFSNPDLLLIFAAGNSGVDANKDGRIDSGSISSPGTAKNVLTVGASKNYVLNGGIQHMLKELGIGKENWGTEPLASSRLSDNAQGLAPFSSRGPTQDGRLKPDVVAPGTNILSVHSQHEKAEVLWGEYNKDYVWSGGTSMSTPLVAGAAAVVRQYLIEKHALPNPSAAIVKASLMHSAVDLFPGQFGEIGKTRGQELLSRRPNHDEGYGRVDIDRATNLAGAIVVDEKTGLAAGESHKYSVEVTSDAVLTATLVYTDAPGAAGAAQSLVNDLDLVLVTEEGVRFDLKDRVNNSEMIEREVSGGRYTIEVRGENVPHGVSGKQPYALIISVR